MTSLSLALGLGLGPRGGAFNPASTFANGEQGFWGEVTMANCWQDAGRTLPVTAVGQSVNSWLLYTAAGPIYVTVTGAPTYQIHTNGKHCLQFSGAQLLQTPSITPGTSKVQAFAGVRKLSDAGSALVMETGTGAGSFSLNAPRDTATANYGFTSRGASANADARSTSTFAAPHLAVIGGIGDTASNVSQMRVNGAVSGSAATVQGGGNYAASVVNIGGRGAGGQRANMLLFSTYVRFGPDLTADQIAQIEAWHNARTGAF